MPAPLASPPATTTRSGTAVITAAFTVLLLATLALFARGLVVVLTGPSDGNPALTWTVASTALVLLPAFVGTAARGDAIRRALGVPPLSTGLGVSAPTILAGLVGLAAIPAVVESLGAGLPVAHVAAALAGAVGVGAVGWILGARAGADAAELRDGLRDGVPFPADVPWDRRAVLLRVAGIAAVAAVAVMVAAAVQAPPDDPTASFPLGAGVLSVGAAGIVAGIVSMLVVQAAGRVVRPLLLDLDAPTRKAVLRRIRGWDGPLEPDREWRAARIARASRIGEAFSSAGMALMLMGVSAVVLGAASMASPDTARVLTAGAVALAFVGMIVIAFLGVAYGMLLVHSSGDAVVALAASPRPGAVDADRWPAPMGAPLG
ncbi:hypothetical protein ITJ44_07945 [Clavibacter sp. VKM Ac-2873]|uniref:hypothetical protein n=1 Tax=Clavibacter sp. VKM Ac-2873 TaxID=2783813 RepID=UPI00188B8C20|nr:hypothetical protein [Clavibacter sp. VKM Ac-2873]MBF4618004.1 hypothetical protein [Clavibacter sp. VKM Ac-2873]